MTPSVKQLASALVKEGWVSEEQVAEAIRIQQKEGQFFGHVLMERGWITSQQLMEALSKQYGLPLMKLDGVSIDPEAIKRVPVRVALRCQAMPLKLNGTTLRVAICNPQDVRSLDELRSVLQQRYTLEVVLATPEEIVEAIKRHYGIAADTVSRLLAERGTLSMPIGWGSEEHVEDITQMTSDASVMKLVNQLILEAHERRATDIHLEPYRGKVRLRYRIDGVLHDVDVPSALRQFFPAILSRIKVLSNLNIVERRLPQDGRATVKVGEEKLDLRVSILPTPQGESVVIRILPSQMLLDLKDLGFREEDLKVLEAIIRKPYGLLFVTGPTGSGKTTTLYACLKTINTPDRKIVTIEDPIEYELEGITQVHVNPAIGLTFATGLRSMLRHDPNVMMVGEVRDVETAELAVRIALTGHLVFSTLHTNDAPGGVTRLLEMGIDPYLVVSSVECIIAQRLVRLLCPSCKEEETRSILPGKKAYRSRGCKACNHTGYLGRTAIYEMFLISEPIRELILKRPATAALRRAAIEMGMRTMREEGLEKVEMGLTTLDEVLRVTQDEPV